MAFFIHKFSFIFVSIYIIESPITIFAIFIFTFKTIAVGKVNGFFIFRFKFLIFNGIYNIK